MKLNDTAAAYGLFQVVFADVVDHLAVETFLLRKGKEPDLKFETVFACGVSDILNHFRAELRQFDDRSPVSDSLREIREACDIISTLIKWRNDRAHARVRVTESGYALYNWRTGHRLDLDCEQIEHNIELAVKAIVVLEAHVQHLTHQLSYDEELEKLLSTTPELWEPPELFQPSSS